MSRSTLHLGAERSLDGLGEGAPLCLPTRHLVTHGVVVGMTGSGKTGLLTVTIEETLGAGIPVLILDVKGDLPNLLLTPSLSDPSALEPWLDEGSPDSQPTRSARARVAAAERRSSLEAWGVGEEQVQTFRRGSSIRVLTPGSLAGEPLHLLSALERRSPLWDSPLESDVEAARASLSAAVSLVLRLLGREADPTRSPEHILLSVLAQRRLCQGQGAELSSLLEDLASPPLERVGALPMDIFLPKAARRNLAVALNALLASPAFQVWRQGASLDVGSWLGRPRKPGEPTPAVIVSVAHLDEEERALVLGLVLEEVLSWVRTLPGTQSLRALVVFDEVYGYLPPHPSNPPTKRPLVSLLKQGRAFGLGVLVATQNPMDLDYRALGNAGLWCIGRLQTDADRARVVDGLSGGRADRTETRRLTQTLSRLAPRWFVFRDARRPQGPCLLQPRTALSLLRGPMTRIELRRALGRGE